MAHYTVKEFECRPIGFGVESLRQVCQTQNTVRAAQLVLKGKNVPAGRSLKISDKALSFKDLLSLIYF